MGVTPVGNSVASGPAVRAFAVTKSDSTVFTTPTRWIYIGGTGNVAVMFNGDTVAVTMNTVPVGMYEWSVIQVLSTGTTATNIVGLY
jgi:hypothetical protein